MFLPIQTNEIEYGQGIYNKHSHSERGRKRGTWQSLVLSNFETCLSRHCEGPLIWAGGVQVMGTCQAPGWKESQVHE